MAKLDIESLQALKELRKVQKEQFREFQRFYHSLASLYHELKTKDEKNNLVNTYPEISAEIFYYFDDSEIGGLIVKRYASDYTHEKRLLAQRVHDVLQIRSKAKSSLENVLKMNPIFPLFDEKGEEEYDIYLDNAERAYDKGIG